MSAQLDLPYDGQFLDAEHLAGVLAELNSLIDNKAIPHKDIVSDCGVPKSTLSAALHQQSGHHVSLEVLIYCLRRAPTDRLLELLAAIRGRALRPLEMTAEQKLAAASRWLSENPALRKTFEEDTGVKL